MKSAPSTCYEHFCLFDHFINTIVVVLGLHAFDLLYMLVFVKAVSPLALLDDFTASKSI